MKFIGEIESKNVGMSNMNYCLINNAEKLRVSLFVNV